MKRSMSLIRLVGDIARALSRYIGRQCRAHGSSSRRGWGDPDARARITCQSQMPQARKEALVYCRRCLAVMVCCVLVFSLTVRVTPRAKAVAVADDVAILGLSGLAGAANSFGQHPVEGSLGQYIITGSGVKIKSGTVLDDLSGKTYFDAKAQELGVELVTYLTQQTGEVAEWIGSTVTGYQAQGGLAPGDSFEIPAAVVAAARQWLQTALAAGADDNGVTSFHSRLILGGDEPFLLTSVDTSQADIIYSHGNSSIYSSPVVASGTLVKFPSIDLSENYTGETLLAPIGIKAIYSYSVSSSGSRSISAKINIRDGSLNSSGGCCFFSAGGAFSESEIEDMIVSNAGGLFYDESCNRILGIEGFRDNFTKVVYRPNLYYYNLKEGQSPSTVSTTMTKTDSVDETPAAPITVTVPPDLPVAQVGDYTVPMAAELTPDVVTGAQDPVTPTAAPVPGTGITAQDIAGAIGQAVPGAVADGIAQALPDAIAQALPITGAAVGDQMVADTLAEPDSLGAVFISKFPFSIPWDVVKAIQLLAVPPTPPKFEFNMYSAMEGYGGFHCDTPVVIDFEPLEPAAAIVRWASTLGFVYALAMGTKRLIWTA